jgi:hypothetical protein
MSRCRQGIWPKVNDEGTVIIATGQPRHRRLPRLDGIMAADRLQPDTRSIVAVGYSQCALLGHFLGIRAGRPTGACPGYIKDHVVPLACGGPDAVGNLQWQTTAEARAKDKWERKSCGR